MSGEPGLLSLPGSNKAFLAPTVSGGIVGSLNSYYLPSSDEAFLPTLGYERRQSREPGFHFNLAVRRWYLPSSAGTVLEDSY